MKKLPKGIRQRGTSFFVDASYKGERRTATCATLEAAVTERLRLLAEMRGGPTFTPAAAWTLQRGIDKTMEVAWIGTRSEGGMALNCDALVAHFGADLSIKQITALALDDFVAALKAKGNSNATINRKLASLSKIMSVALDRGGLDVKPKFPHQRESKGRIRFLTDEEESAMLAHLQDMGKLDVRDAVVVLIDTGLRVGELLRLTWQDVERTPDGGGMIHVWENKADHPRSVPMTSRVRAIMKLRQHKAAYTPGAVKVFDLPYHVLRLAWGAAKARMGLSEDKQFIPHALRHTCASRLVQRGVDIRTVQEFLGHKNITQTMRYAHLSPRNLRAAALALEAPLAAE